MENEQKNYKNYFVVTALNLEDLVVSVEERLKFGWRCQGSIFIYALDSSDNEHSRLYHQAMVK